MFHFNTSAKFSIKLTKKNELKNEKNNEVEKERLELVIKRSDCIHFLNIMKNMMIKYLLIPCRQD